MAFATVDQLSVIACMFAPVAAYSLLLDHRPLTLPPSVYAHTVSPSAIIGSDIQDPSRRYR